MGIAVEILRAYSGPPEGWCGIDHPIFTEERAQPDSEELGMGERCEFSGQVQLTGEPKSVYGAERAFLNQRTEFT